MGIADHQTCLLRNLNTGQEATVRTGHRTTEWFQIRKGVRQGYILSHCLFNFFASKICEMPGWMKHRDQDGGRNTNNLRYADGTTLMAESKEKLKSFLNWKEGS